MNQFKAHIGSTHAPSVEQHPAAPEAVVEVSLPRPYELPRFYEQATGVLGIILFSALLIGSLSILLRRYVLAVGSLTVFMLIIMPSFILMQEEGYHFISVAIGAGMLGDVILWFLKRNDRYTHPYLFCFLFPFLYYVIAFAVLYTV